MLDTENLRQHLALADQLVNLASREELVECARLLAMNLAHYQMTFGELPIDAALDAAFADEPIQAQIDLSAKAMEQLVGVLGGLIQGFEPKPAN